MLATFEQTLEGIVYSLIVILKCFIHKAAMAWLLSAGMEPFNRNMHMFECYTASCLVSAAVKLICSLELTVLKVTVQHLSVTAEGIYQVIKPGKIKLMNYQIY